MARRVLRFSYFEASTNDLLSRSVVVRCKTWVNLLRIQEEARASGMLLTMIQVGEVYSLVSFSNEVNMNRVLMNGSSWFEERSLDISTWDSFDLASSSIT